MAATSKLYLLFQFDGSHIPPFSLDRATCSSLDNRQLVAGQSNTSCIAQLLLDGQTLSVAVLGFGPCLLLLCHSAQLMPCGCLDSWLAQPVEELKCFLITCLRLAIV